MSDPPAGANAAPSGQAGEAFAAGAPMVRRPKFGVSINGKRVDELLVEGSVGNNRYFSADNFNVVLAMRDGEPLPFKDLLDADSVEVEVYAAIGGEGPATTALVMGRADDVEPDFVARTIRISGRDYTADMLEAKTTEKWPNKTASEIAQEIAGRHGLRAVVTATEKPSGHYYKSEHARLTDDTTEWNLLTYLAEREGMEVYVKGRELHFEPPPDPANAQKFLLRYEPPAPEQGRAFPRAPTTALRMRRSMSSERDVSVKVISWNARGKKAVEGIARSTLPARSAQQGRFGNRAQYVYRIPGLTEEQCLREAQRILADISKHHRTIAASIPGDPRVDVRTMVKVEGTGTSFDQDYRVDEIAWEFSRQRGLEMAITLRNLSPQNTAAL